MVRSLLVLAVAGAVVSPPPFVVDKPSAGPHEFVVAKTAGKRALKHVRKRPLRLYLDDVSLGRVSVSRRGTGRLRFEVPNLPAGRYSLRLRGLPRRPILRTVGSFEVTNAQTPVRTCAQSVYGKVSDDYIARSLHVGPLRLVGYDPVVASTAGWAERLRNARGEYAQKVLLLVERGAQATITIAPADRRDVALLYLPQRFNAQRVTDGDAAVTFAACGETESEQPYTQFNGGYIFRRPVCAHISVAIAGRPEPISVALPLGKTCPSK